MHDQIYKQLADCPRDVRHAFSSLAEQIARSFSTAEVLLVGPETATLLGEALRERGMETRCECLAPAAQREQTRADMRILCSTGLASAPSFDYSLVVAVDVFQWSDGSSRAEDIAYLKRRAKSVLFVFLDDDTGTYSIHVPLLEWIDELSAHGLVPVTSFDVTVDGADAMLFAQDRPPLEKPHLLDYLRLRRATKALKTAEKAVRESARETLALNRIIGQYASLHADQQLSQHSLELALKELRAADTEFTQRSWPANTSGSHEHQHALAQALAQARHELGMVYRSTSWRITAPMRFVGHRLPVRAMRLTRMGMKLLYWTFTFQLGSRLRARRAFRRAHRM
ncbi:MAG: hypothetical protein ACRYGR_07880 [Janthinobacterium lividum]